jgi:hypothetical protein
MVIGIIALLLSWVPFINNIAALLALVGLGLGIPGVVQTRRSARYGGGSTMTGLAITGLVTSALAFVLVLATQYLFVSAVDGARDGLESSQSAPADPNTDQGSASAPAIVPLGVPARVGDYDVTVDAVELNGNDLVAGANSFNDPPTGQYVVVTLTATYVGAEEGMPGWELTAIFHGSNAVQYRDGDCAAVLPDDSMNAPTLNPGGSDTFQFCMDVPPTAIEGGQLSMEPTMSFDSDARVFFAFR